MCVSGEPISLVLYHRSLLFLLSFSARRFCLSPWAVKDKASRTYVSPLLHTVLAMRGGTAVWGLTARP